MARAGRTAGVLLFVVVALAVGGDFAARLWAENVLAGRLRTELALSERPDVDIGGFPFLLGLAKRRFPTATVEARDLRAEDVDIRSLHLELRDVRFSTAGGVVRAGSGMGRVELGEQEVSSHLQEQGFPLAVAFLGPEVRVTTNIEFAGQSADATATGRVELQEGRLLFRPESIEAGDFELERSLFRFEMAVPRVIEGIRYDSVLVKRGFVELSASVGETIVRLGGS